MSVLVPRVGAGDYAPSPRSEADATGRNNRSEEFDPLPLPTLGWNS